MQLKLVTMFLTGFMTDYCISIYLFIYIGHKTSECAVFSGHIKTPQKLTFIWFHLL